MRKFIFLAVLFASCGVHFDRPIERVMSIRNFSEEAVYVQYTYHDKLQFTPKLDLFMYLPDRVPEEKDLDPYCSPEYRINPHTSSTIADKYDYEEEWIPFPNKPDIDYVNFFFIKESVMKNYTWEEIVAKQLYEKKVRYTYKELKKMNYEISYKP